MKNNNNPQKNRRNMTRVLMLFTGVIFLIFAIRFSMIMMTKTVNGENLSERIENLYTRSSILPAKRGTIYDIGGNPIALDATSYSLIGVLTDKWSNEDQPNHIIEKEKTAEALAKHIDLSKSELLEILNQTERDQVEFGEPGMNLTYGEKIKIEEEKLPGIVFQETPSRLYPNGVFASHLVGYAAISEESKEAADQVLTGFMGVEEEFDKQLKGTDGEVIRQQDSQGYALPGMEMVLEEPTDGKDIYMTLDLRLQTYLESLITTAFEESKPKSMTAMLVNAKTGAIEAATQRPSFNATTMEGIDLKWQNLLVEETFEPGSTFKVLTLAAAINEGVFQPQETYQSGSIAVEGGIISDFNKIGWGEISYLEGFARSSNVAVVKLIEKMGFDVWESYMQAFGISTSTNSGLSNEAKGHYNFDYPLEQANTAFGQGVTVTPFQLVQAFTAISNGGTMMKIHYIDKIVDPKTKEVQKIEPEVLASPITPETAKAVLNYLTEVVYTDYGTASAYQIDNARVGVKTGTAELVNPETGMYYTGTYEYLYSAIGFAPIEDPEYILYVTLELPQNNEPKVFVDYLSEVFNPLMTRAVSYAQLGNEDQEETVQAQIPKVTQLSKEEAITKLEEDGFGLISTIGTGSRIVQQYPAQMVPTLLNQRIILMTEGAMTMPDVSGWSRDDVLKVSELTGVNFQFKGEGFVSEQDLPAGSLLDTKKTIHITLE